LHFLQSLRPDLFLGLAADGSAQSPFGSLIQVRWRRDALPIRIVSFGLPASDNRRHAFIGPLALRRHFWFILS
jgi:hypothetical protein